ncbi:MAG: polyphosphate kinase 1, partial [Kiritimatiellae bacterium]|nr:polyphosphate kinase 1 [Kiritimatiellia bacterium]
MAKKPSRFINRELSWLEFNQRVIEEARDTAIPLLERLKFLAITASNLDEFFMVRVGGLQALAKEGLAQRDAAGLTPQQQIEAIGERVRTMVNDQYACYLNELEPALASAGITRVRADQLSEQQTLHLERLFKDELSVVVTPMAIPTPDRFPLLVNLSLNIAVRLKPAAEGQAPRFATMPVGPVVRRFMSMPAPSGYAFMLAEDVLRLFIAHLFPGEEIMEAVPYRITRNADMTVREDLAADLLDGMRDVLDARKQSDCVRLEVDASASRTLLAFLQRALKVRDQDVLLIPGPLNLADFMQLAVTEGFDQLKCEPWPPQPVPGLDPRKTIFEELARRDLLLVHPYDSFEPVLRLVREAADDPDVLAIKQILYRTSRNSPVIAALKRAAEHGKYVTALVELKARFDEARNIAWAEELEQAGAQVIYGVKGLKTHAKVCIVVRRQPQGIVRYVHFGTGNYNEITARLYSDISFMTCREDLCADASAFFNMITGYSQPQR